jgi:hypothetical protein
VNKKRSGIVKTSWFLVLPILFFSAGSPAQEPDKKQMEQIFRDANLGNPKAQLYLGSLYGNGKGVPLDHAEAAKWYRKAAEQGYAKAQWYLGLAYYSGTGVPRDYAEAVKWQRKAADQGLAEAQIELGNLSYRGEGVPQDLAEAEKWYRKAAEQGNAKAKDYLRRIGGKSRTETFLQYLFFPLVYFLFWGPFACFYVAKAIARRVIERSSHMVSVLAASAAQLALFTPIAAHSIGGNIPVVFPWWAVLLGIMLDPVLEQSARFDMTIGSFFLYFLLSIPISFLLSIPISILAIKRTRLEFARTRK